MGVDCWSCGRLNSGRCAWTVKEWKHSNAAGKSAMAQTSDLRYRWFTMANKQAPDFTLPDEDGNPVSLKQFRGKTVVLFFYPKANTPG